MISNQQKYINVIENNTFFYYVEEFESNYAKSTIIMTNKLKDYSTWKISDIISRQEEFSNIALRIWNLKI